MAPRLLSAPAINAEADVLVDWLELTAFFDQYARARIDDIAGSDLTQREEPPDFATADLEDDWLRNDIENEIEARKKALEGAYPFDLDEDGEELQFLGSLDDPATCFYLLCLVASHVTKSSILLTPPSDELVRQMRKRPFQILGTLAVAGFVNGPAVSVGYPRESKEGILEVLNRARDWGIGMEPRDKPGRHATPQTKDGGIDVIGWPMGDRPLLLGCYSLNLLRDRTGEISRPNPSLRTSWMTSSMNVAARRSS